MSTNTETMSPEAQRIAIATACGWRLVFTASCRAKRWWRGEAGPFYSTPDYLNDLNAAMEVVNHMCRNGQTVRIDSGLDGTWEVTFGIPNGDYTTAYAASESLAATICEAALNSLNLWKP